MNTLPATRSELQKEQWRVQGNKFKGRLLAEYDKLTFRSDLHVLHNSDGADFLMERSGASDPSIAGLLHGMSEIKAPGTKVHWVDMASGRGLAQRQLANLPYAQNHVTTTSVDLFNYGLRGLRTDELTYLETKYPGITSDQVKPNFIRDDVETVTLPEPGDLITSIEAIQYLHNPLACIANWYNQLTDDGIVVVSSEDYDWARNIRYRDIPTWADGTRLTPTRQFLEELAVNGIAYAITTPANSRTGYKRSKPDPSSFEELVIQKRPGTKLLVHASLAAPWQYGDGYKIAYYNWSPDPIATVQF